MRLRHSLDSSAVHNSIMVCSVANCPMVCSVANCPMIRKLYWKRSSCQCSFLVSKGFIPDLAVMVKHRCCCFTTDVLHRERGCIAKYSYLPLSYFKNTVILLSWNHTCLSSLDLTNTNFIILPLQVCDIFSLKYPKPHCPRGESVGQKGCPGWNVVPLALVNENWLNYFVLFSSYVV